jgi:hypothetical protein
MLSLLIESWIWYSVAIFVALCRTTSRSLLFGSPFRLKFDDWLMFFGIATYTTLVVTMNIVSDKSSNLIPPGVDVSTFTKAEVQDRVLGSKVWTISTTVQV